MLASFGEGALLWLSAGMPIMALRYGRQLQPATLVKGCAISAAGVATLGGGVVPRIMLSLPSPVRMRTSCDIHAKLLFMTIMVISCLGGILSVY